MAVMIPKKPLVTRPLATGQKPVAPAPFKLGTTLDELNAQKAHAATQRQSAGWNTRRSQIDTAIGKLTPAPVPAGTTSQVGTPTTPPDGLTAGTATGAPVQEAPTMKTTYDFVPKTMGADPIYEQTKNQGLSDLDKYYASKGIRQTGARDAAAAKFMAQTGADAYARQQQVAGNEADRYERTVQNEANRLQTQGQNQFSNLRDILSLAASQSPMQYAYNATGQAANGADSQGKTLASYLAQMYGKSSGGGGAAPVIPPFASSPDFTNSNYANIANQGQSNKGWLNIASSILGGLF